MNELPELIKAFGSIDTAVAHVTEYRLYYDEHGNGLFMSMSGGPEGNYITIPQQVYDRAVVHNLKVAHGELITIDENSIWLQMRKAQAGYKVVKNHPALLIENNETYPDIEYYDRNN